jgi:formylglycine-generating enzyme required for sulfatase activity
MGGEKPAAEDAKKPKVEVNYLQIIEFCKKLEKMKPGLGVRLPTELEWIEMATKEGLDRQGEWSAHAWLASSFDTYEKAGPQPVASKLPNGRGMYDMFGNAAEWTSTPVGIYPNHRVMMQGKPVHFGRPVAKGGSWASMHQGLSHWTRKAQYHNGPTPYLGFRIVLYAKREADTSDWWRVATITEEVR